MAGGGRLDQAEGGTGQEKVSRTQEAPEGWGGGRSALRLGQAQWSKAKLSPDCPGKKTSTKCHAR